MSKRAPPLTRKSYDPLYVDQLIKGSRTILCREIQRILKRQDHKELSDKDREFLLRVHKSAFALRLSRERVGIVKNEKAPAEETPEDLPKDTLNRLANLGSENGTAAQ